MSKASVSLAIVCVNYFCEHAIIEMAKTIEGDNGTNFKLVIVDNSASFSEAFKAEIPIDSTILKPKSNLGYFGAFSYAIDKERLDKLDFIILSNPDIFFSSDFFSTLAKKNYDEDVLLIAPGITNMPIGNPANPFMMTRPSSRSIFFRKFVHSNSMVFYVYRFLHVYRKKLIGTRRVVKVFSGQRIYAAHGSLIVIPKNFFRRGGQLTGFPFLFGEEIVLAERVREIGGGILYDTDLRATHLEHVATGLLGARKRARYIHSSLNAIYNEFFNR